MRTRESSKVFSNLKHLARGVCKVFQVSCTEICLVDNEVISLLKGIEAESKQQMRDYMDMGEVHVTRCSFDKTSRINQKSHAFGLLAKEYPKIKSNRAILFKHNAIFIPIVSKWRREFPEIIGCIIVSKTLANPGANSPMKNHFLKSS